MSISEAGFNLIPEAAFGGGRGAAAGGGASFFFRFFGLDFLGAGPPEVGSAPPAPPALLASACLEPTEAPADVDVVVERSLCSKLTRSGLERVTSRAAAAVGAVVDDKADDDGNVGDDDEEEEDGDEDVDEDTEEASKATFWFMLFGCGPDGEATPTTEDGPLEEVIGPFAPPMAIMGGAPLSPWLGPFAVVTIIGLLLLVMLLLPIGPLGPITPPLVG